MQLEAHTVVTHGGSKWKRVWGAANECSFLISGMVFIQEYEDSLTCIIIICSFSSLYMIFQYQIKFRKCCAFETGINKSIMPPNKESREEFASLCGTHSPSWRPLQI